MDSQPPNAAVANAMAFLFSAVSTSFSRKLLILLLSGILITAGSCKKKEAIPFNPEFAQYVSAFTTGNISAASTIRIRLTDAFAGNVETGVILEDKLLEFSPRIDGQLVWVDQQTLEFTPSEWLERGTLYEATLHLSSIVKEVPEHLRDFVFSFQAMNQGMNVNVTGITPYRTDDLRWMQLSGTVLTADVADPEALAKVVTAEQNGRNLSVSWSFNMSTLIHTFTVDSIERTEKDGKMKLSWNGKLIGADAASSLEQEIPALGNFKVFFHSVIQQPEQYVQLQFSDPLDPGQDLRGLIELVNYDEVRYSINSNEVRVYPPYRLSGDHVVRIHAGVRNIMGYKNALEQELAVTFEEIKPEVEIPDVEKNILPSTDGLVLPFRAVNLRAVDVRV
ncbi:MAG: hypothetical protein JNM00_14875, partial [Flavobacteriales bacterium]|nr:hypothetical protein [Flavobacteriales bacterium]